MKALISIVAILTILLSLCYLVLKEPINTTKQGWGIAKDMPILNKR